MPNKTQPTNESVIDFLNTIEKEQKQNDAFEILKMMQTLTGEEPVLWGNGIVGFGQYRYRTNQLFKSY